MERAGTSATDDALTQTELPILAHREELLDAISTHQVIVVAGETGSGKSTQLPQLCLEAGRGAERLIGHTQPRRIAARSIAERVASELGTRVGDRVGYKVRFDDQVGPRTALKVMTDGVLLAEIPHDRELRAYDTLIIDEAHERSLNVDFLLGFLHHLLPRRRDLSLIITSATIDTERFSTHFGGAPVVEVSGRSYPVELRYRPLDEPMSAPAGSGTRDLTQAICDAVRELSREGPGDLLVFCSGEREIRDAADALRGMRLGATEILPLYSRLTAAEQHRVFAAHPGRRIVLATNVAETSLTVPGIRYVIDPGTARISRYNRRTKVQRLPIEEISQASADQRAGRCGRIGPGTCVRLYSEESFLERPHFTEPEIQRTNLASVILQMAALGLGDPQGFGFIDPPDVRSIQDGVALLRELGALDATHPGPELRLTGLGRRLARLPLDPRLGRMILGADRLGCLHEVMVITAALSIQDPRERPSGPDNAESAAAAARFHARFERPGSDLLGWLDLWDHLREAKRGLTSGQFRRLCRAEHLHLARVREWQDLYAQLRQVTSQMRLRHNTEPAKPDNVHRAILTGLLSQIGARDADGTDFRGTRGSRFAIARGSTVDPSGSRWVMAAELVETNRLWARQVARIRPEWIEQAAGDALKRSHGEAWWDPRLGTARCHESTSLYGLVVVRERETDAAKLDPALARRLFIDHALIAAEIDGRWASLHALAAGNAEVRADAEELSARVRQNLLVDTESLRSFYDGRIPAGVTSARQFERWWRELAEDGRRHLCLDLETLLDRAADELDLSAYPDEWTSGDLALPLGYVFDPASAIDGVTVHVSLGALPGLVEDGFSWGVTGHRRALIDALIRSLPKTLRRALGGRPEIGTALGTAARSIDAATTGRTGIRQWLASELTARTDLVVRADDFDLSKLPPYLSVNFRILDVDGTPLAVGKDLVELRERLAPRLRAAISATPDAAAFERCELSGWPDGGIPRRLEVRIGAEPVVLYPSLVAESGGVALRLLTTAAEQAEAAWDGTRLLLLHSTPAVLRALERMPGRADERILAATPWGSRSGWAVDCADAAIDRLMEESGGPAWDQEGFEGLRRNVREQLPEVLREAAPTALAILHSIGRIRAALSASSQRSLAASVADIRGQLERLVYPGVLTSIGLERFDDLARYLLAVEHRLERMGDDHVKDQERMLRCIRLEQEFDHAVVDGADPAQVEEVSWLLQELRVATFAQQLGTSLPVSEQRVLAAIARLA